MDLTKWAAPAVSTRDDDTVERINADPTVFVHRRGSVDLPSKTGRLLAPTAAAGGLVRSTASQVAEGEVRVLFAAGTDVRREDRLAPPGGAAYRVFFVYPNQRDRTLVAAQVVSK